MRPSAEPERSIPREMVRAQLSRVLASGIFANSQRLSRFLQFVVERATEGKPDELKEYAIGLEVFERKSDFDPRIDTIVRVQAAKLRSKLLEYYNSDGRDDAVIISIPKGGYAPVFTRSAAVRENSRERAAASVAVLPFLNLSEEPGNEYFSDGLTEEIINALTCIPGLQVVARTSVFRFKGQQQDVREIGNQLNAGTILEGSVRRMGTQLRVTAQLVNVEDGYHLWSHTFKRELRDVFAVQEEISRAVRDALAPHFGIGVSRAVQYEPEPAAHDLYLKGRYAQARRIAGDVPQAIAFFEQSIASDPNYARAHAGLAEAWFMLAFWGVLTPDDAVPKAKSAAQRALELDDHLAEAHATLGAIQCSYEWDWDLGQRSIERALELDPDSPTVNLFHALLVLVPRFRLDQALAVLQTTTSLDPYIPLPQAMLTYLLGYMGKLEEAVQQHAMTIATNPHYFLSHSVLAFAYFMNERLPEALQEASTLYEASRRIPQTASVLATMHAANGNVDQAKELLDQVLQARRERYVRATDIAGIYSELGDATTALAWLNSALDEKTMHLYFTPLDPRFRRIRSLPAFQTILNRAGLHVPATS